MKLTDVLVSELVNLSLIFRYDIRLNLLHDGSILQHQRFIIWFHILTLTLNFREVL